MSIYGRFFGQFLVENGVLSPSQLEECLDEQRRINAPLGAMALESGAMTAEQVEDVAARQRETDERFGKLAVSRGYLSPGGLEDLLRSQGERHLFLGESLVRRGVLDYPRLEELLARFHNESKLAEAELPERLRSADGNEVRLVASTARRFFFRAVQGPVKLIEVGRSICSLGSDDTIVRLALRREEKQDLEYGFFFKRWYLYAFIYCLLGKQTLNDMVIREALSEFAGALNYALCLDLTDCRPDPPLIHLRPEEAGGTESLARDVAEAVCMVMDSPIGRFRVYCKQPVSPEV